MIEPGGCRQALIYRCIEKTEREQGMNEKNRANVERMIQGDRQAFDELYHSYSGKLYRMAYVITGNRSDSEDVLQETFVKCFLHRHKLKEPERFEPWLYRILVRTAWRKGKSRRETSLEAMMEDPENGGNRYEPESGEAGLLEQVLRQEESARLWRLVGELDVKYRTVILLHYYNELGTREIARITGTLEGTVKSRLFQARKLLRKRLEAEDGERGKCYEQKLG